MTQQCIRVSARRLEDNGKSNARASSRGVAWLRWAFALVLTAVSASALAQQTVVANYSGNSLYIVDLSTGNRTVLSDSTTGSGTALSGPVGLTRNSSTGTIYFTTP